MKRLKSLGLLLLYTALTLALGVAVALAWLRWDAGQPREAWFAERQGQIRSAEVTPLEVRSGQAAASVALSSSTGLEVSLRVVRDATEDRALPVLLVLGGHRTGSAAVELFGEVGDRAVVALDYPYAGPQSVDGLRELLRATPLIRDAFLDMPPAVSLTLDWLARQPWADRSRILMVGASLGVPFATRAAARDDRLSGLLLVHGAADNRLWLKKNIARRMETEFLQPVLATVLHWLAYGPVFDTARHVATVSPRPVMIVGARFDERTPAGQSEALYDAAREPKRLRWTEGLHIEPGRPDVIDDLLRIADEEMHFLRQAAAGGPQLVSWLADPESCGARLCDDFDAYLVDAVHATPYPVAGQQRPDAGGRAGKDQVPRGQREQR